MLTDRAIQLLRPLGKDVLKSDGGGLYLRVSRTGAKTFLLRKKSNGVTKYQTLGAYPTLSLRGVVRVHRTDQGLD